MANNAQLTAEAVDLAAASGTEIETEGLTNKQLTELVKTLKGAEAEGDAPPEAEGDSGEQYRVAPGKSLAIGRGVVSAGGELKVCDLCTQEQLDDLVESGYVVKS